MSPIVARATIRAAGRRQFSVMRSLRSFARSFESHPFERMPVTANPQHADWGRMVKRTAGTLGVYFPTAAILLGWPYLGYKGVQGHVGQI